MPSEFALDKKCRGSARQDWQLETLGSWVVEWGFQNRATQYFPAYSLLSHLQHRVFLKDDALGSHDQLILKPVNEAMTRRELERWHGTVGCASSAG